MESVTFKMPRSTELSDFEKGVIIGYHWNGRCLRDISREINYSKSTVAYVIQKWKVSGDFHNMLRISRRMKLGDRDRQVLPKEIRKNSTQQMAHILQEFQLASGCVVINTIRKKAYLLVFMGVACCHLKTLITKSDRAARLMWYKVRRFWIIQQWKPVHWTDESRLTLYRTKCLLSECIVPTVRRRGNYDLIMFF